jgi:TatD DNase family protein
MIDSHIHLTQDQYKEDLEEVIALSKDNGVEKVLLIGCDKANYAKAIELQKNNASWMWLSLGLHPVNASEWEEGILDLFREQFYSNSKFVAIGEIGLDYYWHPDKSEEQKKVFKKQIELAKELKLPIVVHARESYEDCYEILSEYAPLEGVMHSFASNAKCAKKFVDLGMKIGLSGPITFKNGESQREVAREIPISELLLETDGPYLTPVPYRGKRNKPEYIEYVAEEIAKQKSITKDEVLRETAKNAIELFERKDV